MSRGSGTAPPGIARPGHLAGIYRRRLAQHRERCQSIRPRQPRPRFLAGQPGEHGAGVAGLVHHFVHGFRLFALVARISFLGRYDLYASAALLVLGALMIAGDRTKPPSQGCGMLPSTQIALCQQPPDRNG